MMRSLQTILAVVLLTTLAPLACAPQLRALPHSDTPEDEAVRLDHGYGLLYDLLGDEAKVSEILAIKNASAATTALLEDISTTAASAIETIDEMQSSAPPVDLSVTGLPLLETDARNRIANAQTALLLLAFGSFELKILLTQQMACKYAWAIASSLATVDPNADRAEAVSKIATEFNDLYKRVMQQLSVPMESEPAEADQESSSTNGAADQP